jgi:6-phosphofructokinase 1
MNRIAIMTSGGDCPGMNACIRSATRAAISMNIKVFGIEKGYEGLINGTFINLESKDVANTIQRGGTFLRSARSKAFMSEEGQLEATKNLNKFEIDGLIVIGGDGSLRGAYELFSKYTIKVIGIPGSIDNDIYGTDFSLGVDTALNRIINAIDIINDTASSHDRTFLIETMGRNCGYLALMSSIAGGAEAVLIPEVPYDVKELVDKIKKRYESGKTRSIIIVAEGASSAVEIGKQMTAAGGFDIRVTVLGHIQRGGSPTFFDRILATNMGAKAVQGLVNGAYGTMVALKNSHLEYIPLKEVINNKKDFNIELLKLNNMLSN